MWGLIASVAGSLISSRSAKKSQSAAQAWDSAKLQRLVADAKAAGFHPLEALRSQGGGGSAVNFGIAPLASQEVINNAVTGIRDLLTNKTTQGLAQSKATGEINKVTDEEKRAGGGLIIENRTNSAAQQPGVRAANRSATLSRLPDSVESDPWGKLPGPLTDEPETWVDEQNLQVDFRNDSGQVVRAPLGPDIDEWISGKFLEYQADRQMVRAIRAPEVETEELETYETSQTNRLRRLSAERDRAARIQSQKARESAWRFKNQAP